MKHAIAVRILLSLLILIPAAAQAYVTDVWIVPQHPTSADVVTLHVEFALPNSCWSYLGYEFQAPAGGPFRFDARSHSVPGNCFQVIIYEYLIEEVGPLPAGTYTVRAEDHHTGEWANPDLLYIETEFTVDEAVSAEESTWGAIKTLCR